MPKDRDKKTFEEAFDRFQRLTRRVLKPTTKKQEEWIENALKFIRRHMKKQIRER